MLQLPPWGTTFEGLANLEIWRLATAQLFHAKQAHMALNVLTLLLLGNLLEKRVDPFWIFGLWLVAGGMATAISPVFVTPPYDVGTGASQANFALTGTALALVPLGKVHGWPVWTLAALVLLPGFALDFWHAGYPKPGHAAGLLLGMIAGGIINITDGTRHRDRQI